MLNAMKATRASELTEAPREWAQEAAQFATGASVNENDRLTPEWLAERVNTFYGGVVGLDPATNPGAFLRAETMWTEGALQRSWRGYGSVFINPPYHKKEEPLKLWMSYAASQFSADARKGSKDELLFLMPSRTEATYFRTFGVDVCSALVFFTGRIAHPLPGGVKPKGGGRFGSALLYYGHREDEFLNAFEEFGWGFGFGRK